MKTTATPYTRANLPATSLFMDTRLNRLVAIKLLRKSCSNDPGFGNKFHNKVVTVARLSLPNIIEVYDYDQEGNRCFIAMEFVSGSDFKKYLSASAPLSEERVLKTGGPVSSSAATAGRIVDIGSNARYVYAVSKTSGERRWKTSGVQATGSASPAQIFVCRQA